MVADDEPQLANTTMMLSPLHHSMEFSSLQKRIPSAKHCVERRWTFEYGIPIPESENLLDLPDSVQHVLKVASCLESLDEKLLVAACSCEDVSTKLKVANEVGVIVHDKRGYAFVNTETQEAAYQLIQDTSRPHVHVTIGRNLIRNLSQEHVEDNAYMVLRQFHLGKEEIKGTRERHAIAALCRRAAQEAVAESDFVAASMYLEFGISLLQHAWKHDYDLTLALYNAAAEVEYCTANFERMDALVETVLVNATCFRDTQLARATRVYSLGARGRMLEAVQEGMDVLRHLGVAFPKKTRTSHMVVEFVKTRRMLKKTDEMILRMPYMTDPDVIAAMQMLNVVFPNVFKTDQKLSFLVATKMIQLTMQHGLCAISSVGFALYGMLLVSFSEMSDEGWRYGQLSLALLDKFEAREWLPRVYFGVYGNINRLKTPLKELFGPLQHAYSVGMATGDIEFAMLNASLHVSYMLFGGGNSLSDLEKQTTIYLRIMESQKQESAIMKTRPMLQFIHIMMGKNEDPANCTGNALGQTSVVRAEESHNGRFMAWFHFHALMNAYFFSDFEKAEKEALLLWKSMKHISWSIGSIGTFKSLALLAVCNQRSGRAKRKTLSLVRRHLKSLKKRALRCPRNYAGKVFLIQAELAAAIGDDNRANLKFTCAIAAALENGVAMDHAVACERAGRHQLDRGDESCATEYLRRAHNAYSVWGAAGKVAHLETEFQHLALHVDNDPS